MAEMFNLEKAKRISYLVWLFLFFKFHEQEIIYSDDFSFFSPVIKFFTYIVVFSAFPLAFALKKSTYSVLIGLIIGLAFVLFEAFHVKDLYCLTLIIYSLPMITSREIRAKLIGLHILVCFLVAFYTDIYNGNSLLILSYVERKTELVRHLLDVFGAFLFFWTLGKRFEEFFDNLTHKTKWS